VGSPGATQAALPAAWQRGREPGPAARDRPAGPSGRRRALTLARDFLDRSGFEPVRAALTRVVVRNCPFNLLGAQALTPPAVSLDIGHSGCRPGVQHRQTAAPEPEPVNRHIHHSVMTPAHQRIRDQRGRPQGCAAHRQRPGSPRRLCHRRQLPVAASRGCWRLRRPPPRPAMAGCTAALGRWGATYRAPAGWSAAGPSAADPPTPRAPGNVRDRPWRARLLWRLWQRVGVNQVFHCGSPADERAAPSDDGPPEVAAVLPDMPQDAQERGWDLGTYRAQPAVAGRSQP